MIVLRRKTLPAGHWLIATAEGYLAECYLQTGKIEQATPLLEDGYQILLDKLGANHELTILAQKRLKTCVSNK